MTILTSNGTDNIEALGRFRRLALDVYQDDPVWAPQAEEALDDCLDRARAGAVDIRMAVAISGGRTVARALAMRDVEAPDDAGGQVGLFECLPDAVDSGVAVLEHSVQWLRDHGVRRVVAPRVDQLRAGLQVGGFDLPQTIFTAHNPSHYVGPFRSVFSSETRMVSVVFTRQRAPRFRLRQRRAFAVRSVVAEDLSEELQRIETFQREVFAGRIGYLPRSGAMAMQTAQKLLPLLDPDLITLGCDTDGRVIGLLICIPDWWQGGAVPNRARLISVGVAADWRGKGVAMTMGAHLTSVLLDKGYQTLEGSWVLESNRRTRHLARLLGAKAGREFALFSSDLG